MVTIREVVNFILWRGICSECLIIVEDRLRGMGLAEIPACMVKRVDSSYLYLEDGKVLPIHRVKRIECSGMPLLDR